MHVRPASKRGSARALLEVQIALGSGSTHCTQFQAVHTVRDTAHASRDQWTAVNSEVSAICTSVRCQLAVHTSVDPRSSPSITHTPSLRSLPGSIPRLLPVHPSTHPSIHPSNLFHSQSPSAPSVHPPTHSLTPPRLHLRSCCTQRWSSVCPVSLSSRFRPPVVVLSLCCSLPPSREWVAAAPSLARASRARARTVARLVTWEREAGGGRCGREWRGAADW